MLIRPATPWQIAFEIGAQNRARGANSASLLRLARLVVEKWRKHGERFGADLRPITSRPIRPRNLRKKSNFWGCVLYATIESLEWLLRIAVAVILLQTLFFKFTGAKESVYIFTTLGAEPWGRIGSGRPVVRFKRCRIFMILVLQICFR